MMIFKFILNPSSNLSVCLFVTAKCLKQRERGGRSGKSSLERGEKFPKSRERRLSPELRHVFRN